MDIRESAFRKAALMLSTIGAEYAIVYKGKLHTSGDCEFAMKTKDGVLYKNKLEVVVEKPRKRLHDWKDTGYLDILPLLNPGESWEHRCENKEQAVAFQRAITGWASKNWGNGNYISCVKDGSKFEILRLSNTER